VTTAIAHSSKDERNGFFAHGNDLLVRWVCGLSDWGRDLGRLSFPLVSKSIEQIVWALILNSMLVAIQARNGP
jgi:hypothetical protein